MAKFERKVPSFQADEVVCYYLFMTGVQMPFSGAAYDPETLDLMSRVLDEASKEVGPQALAIEARKDMAERILSAVASGERNPGRLKQAALRGSD